MPGTNWKVSRQEWWKKARQVLDRVHKSDLKEKYIAHQVKKTIPRGERTRLGTTLVLAKGLFSPAAFPENESTPNQWGVRGTD